MEERLADAENGFYPDVVSIQDIFLACHLGYVRNRPIGLDPNLGAYPKIGALLERLGERESFKNNPILWWEPGVIGYAGDGKTPVFEK